MQGHVLPQFVLADLPIPEPLLAGGLAAMVALGVFLLVMGLKRAIDSRSQSVFERMNQYGGYPITDADPQDIGGKKRSGRRRGRGRGYTPYVEARESSYTARLGRKLQQADVRITTSEFVIGSVVLMCVGALVGFALPVGGHFLLGIVLLLAGWYGPRIWLSQRWRKRQQAFNNQLADMITLMSSALRAGYGLIPAINAASQQGPQPAATEFARMVQQVNVAAIDPGAALYNLTQRMQSPDLDLFVNALNVQREVGGNLAELMDNMAATIRERNKLLGDVKVLTSQQQYSGYTIALLPVALTLMLAIINPSYMFGVFQQTVWCGWTMALVSVIMIATGFMFIRRIVDIKV